MESVNKAATNYWGEIRHAIPKNDTRVEKEIHDIHMTTPSYDIANSRCSGKEFFTYKNNLFQRAKKWYNEKYYIVNANKIELIMTVLNLSLVFLTIIITVYCINNKFSIKIVPDDNENYSKKALARLNFIHSEVGSKLRAGISTMIGLYAMWALFKRTTHTCTNAKNFNQRKVAVSNDEY